MKAKGRKGFTLLELMIVMTILAVLTVMFIGGYRNYVSSAKATDIVSAYNLISKAVRLYAQNTTYFPNDIRKLWKKDIDGDGNDDVPADWKGPYIELKGGITDVDYYPILNDKIKGTISCTAGGAGTGKVEFIVSGGGLTPKIANEVIKQLGSSIATYDATNNKLTITITTAEAQGDQIYCN
jgi:prepilin-type N-terminal cleavage/methylation domain-containing protein